MRRLLNMLNVRTGFVRNGMIGAVFGCGSVGTAFYFIGKAKQEGDFRASLDTPDAKLASMLLWDSDIYGYSTLGPAWAKRTDGSKTRVMDVDHHIHAFLNGREPDAPCPRDDTSCWMCAHDLYGRDVDPTRIGDPSHTIYPAFYNTGLLLYALSPSYVSNVAKYKEEEAVRDLMENYFDILDTAVRNGVSTDFILRSPKVADALGRVRMPVRVRTKNMNDKPEEPKPEYKENIFMIYGLWDAFLSEKKGVQKLLAEYAEHPKYESAYPLTKYEPFEKPPSPDDNRWIRRFVKEELPRKNGGVRAFVIDRSEEGPVLKSPSDLARKRGPMPDFWFESPERCVQRERTYRK